MLFCACFPAEDSLHKAFGWEAAGPEDCPSLVIVSTQPRLQSRTVLPMAADIGKQYKEGHRFGVRHAETMQYK